MVPDKLDMKEEIKEILESLEIRWTDLGTPELVIPCDNEEQVERIKKHLLKLLD